VYVVDSADGDAMDVARHELVELISKPALAGIPLLVLGNKNDIEGASNVEELITKLQLKDIQGREVCCYSVSAKNQVCIITELHCMNRVAAACALVESAQVNIDITLEWLTKHAKSKK
jgi:ADP-ribosylation factor-like protein 8